MNHIFSLLGRRGCVAFVALLAGVVPSVAYAQQEAAIPDAPAPAHLLTAQGQTPPPLPGSPQTSPAPGRTITLERALDLAKRNNPTLQANQTLILQNKAQEITANLRPNPVLSWDTQYLPLFEPSLFTNSNYWETQVQYDSGIGYLFERGKKRQHRLDAAKTATAVTEAQVADAQRTVLANAAQLYAGVLPAGANLQLAENLLESYRHTVKISQDRFDGGALSKNDLLKIELQTLQFETDVNTDRLAKLQALASLRQFLGFDAVPTDDDEIGRASCRERVYVLV